MRIASILFLGTLSTTLALGCAGKRSSTTDTEGLDSESAALVEDNDETSDQESELEVGVEDPLSGASEGGEVDVAATDEGAAEKARSNPGIFFKPAGCIQSTRVKNVVTHVFTNCTGPHGLVSFNGTVKSTWTRIANGLQVQHVADDFKINGATVDHTVTIQYTKAAGVYTKTRKGSSSGTTAKGRAIAHSADYVTTYNPVTRCITRNGSSQTTIGGREFSRSISGYERCGIGLAGCPKSGTFTLKRPKLDLVLSFPGGAKVDITVNGKKVTRPLLCNASAS